VVFRQVAKNEIVDGEHCGERSQWYKEMLGGMEKLGSREKPVEANAGQLTQPDQHAPRLVTQGHGTGRQALQSHQRLYATLPVVEKGITTRIGGDKGAREAFGVPPQPGAAMDRSGDIQVDSQRLPPTRSSRALDNRSLG
jgi:hypothetical protein